VAVIAYADSPPRTPACPTLTKEIKDKQPRDGLTPQQINKIVDMRSTGAPVAHIASTLAIAPKRVNFVLDEHYGRPISHGHACQRGPQDKRCAMPVTSRTASLACLAYPWHASRTHWLRAGTNPTHQEIK
jgi:hypothetical protein